MTTHSEKYEYAHKPVKDKETSLFYIGERASCFEEFCEILSIIVQRGCLCEHLKDTAL